MLLPKICPTYVVAVNLPHQYYHSFRRAMLGGQSTAPHILRSRLVDRVMKTSHKFRRIVYGSHLFVIIITDDTFGKKGQCCDLSVLAWT